MTVAKVRDMDEAVERANAVRYGLGSTVFSKRNGPRIAARLRSGMTSINAPFSFAGVASLPFGGVGDSGFGRIHGPEGLREFARPKAVARQRFTVPIQLTTFTRTEKTDKLVGKLITVLHGRRGNG
jgi:acyl-CoA reductase-like NAD-dependent aldehyde dehydrogenase